MAMSFVQNHYRVYQQVGGAGIGYNVGSMRNMILLTLAAATVCLHLATPVTAQIRVSANGRYLEDSAGKPFFYMGDTAWELLHRLNREESEQYLRNRAAKGFTVIQAVALPLHGDLNDPNAYGDPPLRNSDPSTPNEAYFRHVDFVVDKAGELGLTVGFLPAWGRHWRTRTAARVKPMLTAANARAYGEFLGKRYRSKRVIWILGGDENPVTPEERATMDALAAGLAAGDGGTHPLTFHPRGPGLSSTFLTNAKWLDFHMVQSSHAARDHDNGLYIEHDRSLDPPKPTVDGEPRYESLNVGFYLKDHNRLIRFDDADARQAAYWAMLAGACGHTYGNNNIWQMWAPGREPQIFADIPWDKALDHPGAFQMGHLRKLFESRPWHLLEPAQSWIASGPRDGGAKVRAALASDSSFAFIYSPQGAQFTVDQRRIRGERLRESWFDPRYGTTYPVHTSDTKGFQTYTPPTSGRGQDWVLILDDEAAGYPVRP
jgi:hypothetical protein